MKTKEQIEVAITLIEELKDYIELSTVEKKLKTKDNVEVIADRIEIVKENIFLKVKAL